MSLRLPSPRQPLPQRPCADGVFVHPDDDDLDDDEVAEDDFEEEDEDEDDEGAWGDEPPDEPEWQVDPDRRGRVH